MFIRSLKCKFFIIAINIFSYSFKFYSQQYSLAILNYSTMLSFFNIDKRNYNIYFKSFIYSSQKKLEKIFEKLRYLNLYNYLIFTIAINAEEDICELKYFNENSKYQFNENFFIKSLEINSNISN